SLQKRPASAVGMKAKTLIKDEARKDQRPGIDQKRNGNERKVSKHKNDKDFKVLSLRFASEDKHGDVKERKGNDVLTGDDAPDLRIEGLSQHANHGEQHQGDHGQAQSGKERYLFTERQSTQRNEEHQNAERDPVRVKRKKVRWPKQKNRHRRHIKNRRKRYAEVKRPQRQSGNAPKGVVVTVPEQCQATAAHGSAVHGVQTPSGANSTRTVLARMSRSKRRFQFSM